MLIFVASRFSSGKVAKKMNKQFGLIINIIQ